MKILASKSVGQWACDGEEKGKGPSDHFSTLPSMPKIEYSEAMTLVRLSQSAGSLLDMLTSNPDSSTHICHNYLFASIARVIDLQCLHRWSIGTSGTSRNGLQTLDGPNPISRKKAVLH